MKRIILASIILILVPTMIFVPVYALMYYQANTNVKDYTDDVIGRWEAFQYYHEAERIVCDETNNLSICFDQQEIQVSGSVLENTQTSYSWNGGTSLSYKVNDDVVTMFLDFDSKNNLQIKIENTSYTILLRKAES